MKTKYTKEEEELLTAIESGEFVSMEKTQQKLHQKYAMHALKKDKRVNIRISERDLLGIQKRASLEGIPYQTLISSLIHKYLNGRLVDVNV